MDDIFKSTLEGDVENVKKILQESKVEALQARDEQSRSVLHIACSGTKEVWKQYEGIKYLKEHITIVKSLLEVGDEDFLNAKDKQGTQI